MYCILVVDDDRTVLHLISRAFAAAGAEVLTAGDAQEGLRILADQRPRVDACLLDVKLPDMSGLEAFQAFHDLDAKLPVIFITGSGDSETAIEAMKLGAFDYVIKPLDLGELKGLVGKAVEIRRKMLMPVGLSPTAHEDDAGEQMIGRSVGMQDVYKAIGRVAQQDVTVLVQGESGTGKELVARAIYHHSKRSEMPFLAVNCAAIPETLLESELFGHEKGAFTGADRRRIGKFEQCSGGTIFLDEVGDMPKALQSKILRLLQSQEFERVGGNETVRTDVRVIAATNRNLSEMVDRGEFREDLYYRLKGFVILLPPLRERGDDIVVLLRHFLGKYNRDLGKHVDTVAPETLDLMACYPWPGNVRELQNVVKQSLLNARGSVLTPDALPPLSTATGPVRPAESERTLAADLAAFVEKRLQAGSQSLHAEAIEFVDRFLLRRILNETEGNQSHAARILGITRGSLRNKLQTLGISIEQVVSVTENEQVAAS
jgi:two-component system nitrogen regulation response regulator GlnG